MYLSQSSAGILATEVVPTTPIQDLIYTYDHEAESVGSPSPPIAGFWEVNTRPGSPIGGTDWRIMAGDDNPIIDGSQYWQTQMVKQSDGSHTRTERAVGNQNLPSTNGNTMTSIGDPHYVGVQRYWYGFLFRIDRMDHWQVIGNQGTGGHLIQFHMWNFAPPDDKNPNFSIRTSGGGLKAYLERNGDNGGANFFSPAFFSESMAGTAGNSYQDGEIHALIIENLMDTRTNAQGGIGELRIYVDDNPIPVWEWLNKQNVHPQPDTDNQDPARHPFFKLGGYRPAFQDFLISIPDGSTQIFSYDNYTVHGAGANREGIVEAIGWANRVQ